jgi:hypothetical protein
MSNLRKATQPLATPRTMRRHSARGITSLPAGKMVPLAAFPLLREDAVRSGRLRFSFEMMETAEVLMNAINVRVMAYLVPFLALERFNGSMDQLNLSYQGQPPLEGKDVVPFIETAAFGEHGANAVYKYLGLHGGEEQLVNTAYLESYNQIWNLRAANRSPDLALRGRLQADLAPAFWAHEQFRHIVPDFDQAVIDGEVALNVVLSGTTAPVVSDGTDVTAIAGGIGPRNLVWGNNNNLVQHSGSAISPASGGMQWGNTGMEADLSAIFTEMSANGLSVSLSNIELARKTQAFARLRQQYNAHDDWIINLLMDGISIPDQAFKQPMLLSDKRTIFGMGKRYATDSGNLTESVVSGFTGLDMSVQVPRIGTGGVIMIVAEITPDQLFERQEDPFLHTTDVEQLPQYLRDTLDPEKVDVVKNGRIDTDHDTPNATFGYEPLNARWNVDVPRVGGRFYRPEVDAGFDEDRQRIWAVETANPTLSTDFYLCTTMHTKPFVVTNQDPFEVVTQGDLFIEGSTVFGGHLVEATDDYEKVMAVAPQERIEKE